MISLMKQQEEQKGSEVQAQDKNILEKVKEILNKKWLSGKEADCMTFGENLKRLRLSYCLTQLQMAGRMNISRPYYNKLENDNTSISVTMLIYIAQAANIPINKLLNDSIKVSRNNYNKKQFK